MPVIHYIDASGNQFEADVELGNSLMQGAVDNMIEGILAECGGACACATCHCYIDPAWIDIVGNADGDEVDLLQAAIEPKDNSRLSCQVEITEAMDGLIVHLPASQY